MKCCRKGSAKPRVWDRIKNSGNTVSASIPAAMSEVQDKLPDGCVIGMPAVGAGGPGYRPDGPEHWLRAPKNWRTQG